MTRVAFVLMVAALAVQRLQELKRSAQNEARIRAEGGQEHSPEHFPWMRAMHVLWFLCMLVEGLQRPFHPQIAALGLTLLIAGQWLRYEAIRTLDWRWSVRIFTVPGLPRIETGLYRWIKHPNYLGVALEIAGAPLVHGAWVTALSFTLLNALVLKIRIGHEERALCSRA